MTTATSITLTFPLPPRALHPNYRVPHWGVKHAAFAEYKHIVLTTAWEQLGMKPVAPLATPVTAQATFVHTVDRKRDADNLGASLKALWDGLVQLGLLAGDDTDSLVLLPVQVELGAKRCVRVRLEAGE